MADEDVRRRERSAAASGSLEAEVELSRRRRREGLLSAEGLELAAKLGHPASQRLVYGRLTIVASKSEDDSLDALDALAEAVVSWGAVLTQSRCLAALQEELLPWALGYGDPVRERVEARERERSS